MKRVLPILAIVLALAVTAYLINRPLAPAVPQLPPPEDVAAPPDAAIRHSEGLHFVVLNKGSEDLPTRPFIKSRSTAWTSSDGVTRFGGEVEGVSVVDPSTLRETTPGFATVMAATPIGETRRWWIAADQLVPGWPGLVAGDYTVEIEILDHLDPLPAPDDVARAPSDAVTTESGLRLKVLDAGQGDAQPKPSDTVRVHYSGWTRDGAMFDSSVIRDQPADFPVNGLIAGMTEGLQLMRVGETARLWIPRDLAYGENPRPGAPEGDLVFDVQLLSIQ